MFKFVDMMSLYTTNSNFVRHMRSPFGAMPHQETDVEDLWVWRMELDRTQAGRLSLVKSNSPRATSALRMGLETAGPPRPGFWSSSCLGTSDDKTRPSSNNTTINLTCCRTQQHL